MFLETKKDMSLETKKKRQMFLETKDMFLETKKKKDMLSETMIVCYTASKTAAPISEWALSGMYSFIPHKQFQ